MEDNIYYTKREGARNRREPKRANHGALPCSSVIRRLKRKSFKALVKNWNIVAGNEAPRTKWKLY